MEYLISWLTINAPEESGKLLSLKSASSQQGIASAVLEAAIDGAEKAVEFYIANRHVEYHNISGLVWRSFERNIDACIYEAQTRETTIVEDIASSKKKLKLVKKVFGGDFIRPQTTALKGLKKTFEFIHTSLKDDFRPGNEKTLVETMSLVVQCFNKVYEELDGFRSIPSKGYKDLVEYFQKSFVFHRAFDDWLKGKGISLKEHERIEIFEVLHEQSLDALRFVDLEIGDRVRALDKRILELKALTELSPEEEASCRKRSFKFPELSAENLLDQLNRKTQKEPSIELATTSEIAFEEKVDSISPRIESLLKQFYPAISEQESKKTQRVIRKLYENVLNIDEEEFFDSLGKSLNRHSKKPFEIALTLIQDDLKGKAKKAKAIGVQSSELHPQQPNNAELTVADKIRLSLEAGKGVNEEQICDYLAECSAEGSRITRSDCLLLKKLCTSGSMPAPLLEDALEHILLSQLADCGVYFKIRFSNIVGRFLPEGFEAEANKVMDRLAKEMKIVSKLGHFKLTGRDDFAIISPDLYRAKYSDTSPGYSIKG